jgi:MtN3 and saliva related transmembrane protein
MTFVPYLGALAALLTTAAYIPQAYKTIKTRSTSSLSLPTYLLLFIGTCLWTAYALYIGNVAVLLANAITALLSGIILGIKLTAKPEVPAAE